MPQAEQAFLWFALGMLFAHWKAESSSKARQRSVGDVMNRNVVSQ
jgi:hypothetical protein